MVWGGNRWINYPIAEFFLENGYNVVVYDQRSAGENTAQYTTYGYWESDDLADYVAYTEEQIDEDKQLGIWGTSLGGATTGFYLGTDEANESIDFAILDSPLSNIKYIVAAEMTRLDLGLPMKYMLWAGNIVTKMKLGFSYADVDVTNNIANSEVPLLIINSKADKVTPYFMGKVIYDTVPHTNKDIWTVDDSAHTEAFFDYPEEYTEKALEFMNEF